MKRVSKRALLLFLSLGICAAMLLGQSTALAQSASADCTVFEIKASNPDKPGELVDKELTPLKGKLSKGPFRQWKRFDKLAKHTAKLVQMKAAEFKLVPGGKSKLSVLFRGTIQEDGKKPRLRLSLTIDDTEGRRVNNTGIEQDTGDYFLYVDPRLKIPSGDYILALSCVAK